MKRLLYALSGHKLRFAQVLVLGLGLNAVFSLVDPLIMKLLVDEGLIKRNFKLFVVFAGLVVLVGAAARGAMLGYELLAEKLKHRMAESLTLRMLKAYYDIPYAEVAKSDSGYFISRVYDEPAKVSQGVVVSLIGLFVSGVTLITGFAIAVFLAWRITLILSVVVPVIYYLANRFSPKIKAASERENEEEARLREILGKSVDCYKTVKVFGLYQSVHRRVLHHLHAYLRVFYGRVKTSENYQTLSRICLSFAEALVLMGAGYEVVAGNLSIGGLFAFMNAFWNVIGAATEIVNQVPELSKLKGYVDRLSEFENSARPAGRGDAKELALDNVSFRYDNRNVFDQLTLKIGARERVLIVGPNGSGKTTLGHLLTGFLDPSEGVVRAPALERISAMLAPFYFAPGNLKDNVNYEQLSGEKVTLFWELVRGLGLERRVEADASSELSEGEKKKCQIVMTLLKDAEVYVFDEPLANIDVESRDAIIRTQLAYTQGKTLISIMHGDEKYHNLFDRVVTLKQVAAEPILG